MKPLQPYHIREGGSYWAAWGSKGWTAVRVTSAKRKWANVTRVDPKTDETKRKGAKVRIDEMVKRDPAMKGADKPTIGPAEVFDEVRELRESEGAEEVALAERVAEREELRAEQRSSSLSLAEPDEERIAKLDEAYDRAFGKDIVASWPSQSDW